MASPLFKTFDPDEALPAEIRGRAIRASARGDGLTVEATFLVQPNGIVGGFLCELTEGLSLEERAALLELRARAVSGRWTPATVGKGIATETYASALACDARLAWEDAQ